MREDRLRDWSANAEEWLDLMLPIAFAVLTVLFAVVIVLLIVGGVLGLVFGIGPIQDPPLCEVPR